ncbi:MAG: chitobiase/beta-hexosaminidase C-terminal domain-containing protein [Muribaculaceae bacterium]|nr:chitobiase/beta-hexosaminidase C-terminal domain-containing protein [Muribaculaceae bacterium]
MKDIEFGLDSRLRRQQRFCYCDPALVDLYNESYQLTHPTLNYNNSYEQPFVEGSNRRLTFAPMDGLAGSGLMFIAPKMNMVYGYDSMSDLERIEVLRLDVDTLTVAAKMFFGVQFRTLDFRFLKVVKLATASGNEGGSSGGSTPSVVTTVATPTFSPASWSEGETLTVELATSTAGASIHYTTDGSTPTAESTLYDSTNKITLSATATVKAIAVKDGMTSSEVASKEYTKP